MHHRSAFTLIELLVVTAIIAVLAVVVVLTLNPAQLVQQSRDSGRLSDLANIQTAVNLFLTDQPGASLGNASSVYVSIPDPTATTTLGDQCQGLGLLSLPMGYSYHCAASSTVRNVDGTGWIPVNLKSISVGSPLSSLPQDPIAETSTGLYYTYTTNGTQYEVNAILESQKYKTQLAAHPQISDYPEVAAQGSNLTLSPLWNATGLASYWPFDDASGTTVTDGAGNGANGTVAGTGFSWTSGKIGGALALNQSPGGDVTFANHSSSPLQSLILLRSR